MIKADLHLHTSYSHGAGSPAEMWSSAQAKGLKLIGFSEHSPRPVGFDYTNEYRDRLTRHFPDYVSEVCALREKSAEKGDSACQVLFGLEMDWLDGQEDFIRRSIAEHDFDYLIGSVHFLGRWGFDDGAGRWEIAPQEECDKYYEQYFCAWKDMIVSGLFNIAAHPDLIKIFSAERFHVWLDRPASRELIRGCLKSLRGAGMALELSSAGLRKACREVYPCPAIMRMASELGIPLSMASDAHCAEDVAAAFPLLATYARAFGYDRQAVFRRGAIGFLPF